MVIDEIKRLPDLLFPEQQVIRCSGDIEVRDYNPGMEKTIYTDEYRQMLAWLRLQRKQRGLTMRDLGERLGVHHSWIGRVEQGDRRLDIVEFVRLCREIGCDPYDGLEFMAPPRTQAQPKKAAEPKPTYQISRKRSG